MGFLIHSTVYSLLLSYELWKHIQFLKFPTIYELFSGMGNAPLFHERLHVLLLPFRGALGGFAKTVNYTTPRFVPNVEASLSNLKTKVTI